MLKLGRGNGMLVGRFCREAETEDSGKTGSDSRVGSLRRSGTHVENEGVSWLAISFCFSI